ncbi:hypothetical protein J2Z48_001126 [Croceifilum oryzae]|uniref:Uncharacterized protein n=1 Tax=Croceifilum oryzae TaxID=1553429 RepID=A0AAJ1TEF3_9BACL|nr:hypothetical protein [Croceifilum oryzae]MDQ0416954.1 hypothetical protein [Croceifilum oryzae]
MVDVADLADELSSLYPTESKELISSVKKSVIYNINSLGNPRANGLSIYFPSKDRPSFRSNAVKYDENNFSESYEQFIKGYVDRLLGKEKGIKSEKLSLKKSMMNQDTTGFEVKVSPEDASSLVNVKGIVGQYEAGSTSKIRVLGTDQNHVKLDEKTGIIKGQWNQDWPMLSGQMVPMFVTNQTAQQATYVIPVKVNGEKMELVVLHNKQANTYDVLGAWGGVDPKTGVPDRNLRKVKEGDKIIPLYPTIDQKTNQRGMVDGKEFTAGKVLSLQWQALQKDQNFLYGFELTNFAQNHSISDFTAVK